MKNTKKLSSTLFDVSGIGFLLTGVGVLIVVPAVIALTVWQ